MPKHGGQPLAGAEEELLLGGGETETTALVAAERAHDLLVYYFIVVHQSAEPGREADVARGDTDRPTQYINRKCTPRFGGKKSAKKSTRQNWREEIGNRRRFMLRRQHNTNP
jgi:hypothetical protein